MSLFTEKERADLCYMHDNDPEKLFDATVAAVLEKLTAGVSVEPVGVVIGFDDDTGNAVVDHSCEGPYGPLDDYEGIYNLDQLNTAIAAARVQENERCAKVCESTSWSEDIDVWREMTKRDVSVKSMLACAEAIRASIGETK